MKSVLTLVIVLVGVYSCKYNLPKYFYYINNYNIKINNDLISGNAFQCYRCIAGMDCFKNGDIGSPVNCTAPLNTGCYKTSLTGKIICSPLKPEKQKIKKKLPI